MSVEVQSKLKLLQYKNGEPYQYVDPQNQDFIEFPNCVGFITGHSESFFYTLGHIGGDKYAEEIVRAVGDIANAYDACGISCVLLYTDNDRLTDAERSAIRGAD